jgi:serine/threonine protein kinase
MADQGKSDSLEGFLRSHGPVEEPPLFAAGRVVDGWEVTAFIGRGGSAEVYRVRQRESGTVAAMKVLTRDGEASVERFRREAKILADSRDSAFPRFFSTGEAGGRPYMVLELLEPLPLPEGDRAVADYLLQVCGGVSRLHGLGFVHRDIKPRNILSRASGEPVLIDLGLVKQYAESPVHEGESLSIVEGHAVGVGTPGYAAPEQLTGGDISPATDIHALGMLANECFGGKPPAAWKSIIRRATSSIPDQRFPSVVAFVSAIRRRHLVRDIARGLAAAGLAVLFAAGVYRLAAWRKASSRAMDVKYAYQTQDGKVEISNNGHRAIAKETTGVLMIPSTLGGDPVTSLGFNALISCTNLTGVVIPDSVMNLGNGSLAFGNERLKFIEIGKNVTTFGFNVFRGDTGLTSVTIPASVRSMQKWVFSGCDNLRAVYFLGDAPEADDIFASVSFGNRNDLSPPFATVYVAPGSTGWDGTPGSTNLPSLWQGKPIVRMTPAQCDQVIAARGRPVILPKPQ